MTVLLIYLISCTLIAGQSGGSGSISGTVRDIKTKSPLTGVNLQLIGTMNGAVSDENGVFKIERVSTGSQQIEASYLGYSTRIIADIIVKAGQSSQLIIELAEDVIQSETETVTASYFNESNTAVPSLTTFSREEIRRAPGAAGDISRIITSLPSIAKVDDQSNQLAVRGGNPIETTFFVDQIEIPNINHFPKQGSSGGPIGLINTEMIQSVDFQAAAFPAAYGDRLSAIMHIDFRDGDRESFRSRFNLDLSGAGIILEGPLGDRSSYLLSFRRSYLDLLINSFDLGTSSVPHYGDIQAKIIYEANSSNKLSLLVFQSDDHLKSEAEDASENDMVVYGNQDISELTTGVNWRYLWNKSAYSNTSIAITRTAYDELFYETGTDQLLEKNRSSENTLKFRNSNFIRLKTNLSIEFGAEFKVQSQEFNNYFGATENTGGDSLNAALLVSKTKTNYRALFLQLDSEFYKNWSLQFGLRSEYRSYHDSFTLSPRFSLRYQFDPQQKVIVSYGRYYQSLPAKLNELNQTELELPSSDHYLLAYKYSPSESSLFSVELYYKKYRDFPLDPQQADLFLLDEYYYRDAFSYQRSLNSKGSAESYGLELILQQKLKSDLYGLISVAFSKSVYYNAEQQRFDRIFDNQILFSLEGGYTLGKNWEISSRWIYAGGRPYTPYDISRSSAENRPILDLDQINAERYPDYHSLNLRCDKRFFLEQSTITAYLSLWNVYNRKNIASYYWNQVENRQDEILQWGLLPIIGFQYDF